MKNKLIAVLVICLVLINCIPVLANTIQNTIIGSEAVDETVVEREDYILNSINSMLEIEGKNAVDGNDIDYNKIIRKFRLSNLFEGKQLNKNQMKEFTKNQDIIYMLPIHCDDVTALSTLEIRKPLTEEDKKILSEEDIEFVQEQVGKWFISVKGIRPGNIDYKNTVETVLEKNNIQNSEVYFVEGICNHISLAAVICSDVPDDTRILVLEQYGAETGTLEETFDYQVILEKDKLYTYEEIKAIVDADIEAKKDFPEDSVGGVGAPIQTSVDAAAPTTDNNKIITISAVSGVAVLAIAIAAVCIVKKKKHTKVNNEE